jgi:hypothetical protein
MRIDESWLMHLNLIAAEKSLCYDANAFRDLIRSRAEEAI